MLFCFVEFGFFGNVNVNYGVAHKFADGFGNCEAFGGFGVQADTADRLSLIHISLDRSRDRKAEARDIVYTRKEVDSSLAAQDEKIKLLLAKLEEQSREIEELLSLIHIWDDRYCLRAYRHSGKGTGLSAENLAFESASSGPDQ